MTLAITKYAESLRSLLMHKYKTMWASDLDRTLIFSTGFLKDYPSDSKLIEVEKWRDDFYTYMDAEAMGKLAEYSKDELFVPVTSRTVEQYKRIDFGFQPKYAITSVGGTILENGEPIDEWTKYIMTKLNFKELVDIRKALWCLDFTNVKLLDNCFLFFKSEEDCFSGFSEQFPGWNFIRQGRKNYITPKHLSKIAAIEWLKEQLDVEKLAVSGDSMLDMDMLQAADLAIVPDTAYIKEIAEKEGFKIANGGISSPLEMIKLVSQL